MRWDADPTCLSDRPHHPDGDQDCLFNHYMGCLEFAQRPDFLDIDNQFWAQQVDDEITRLSLERRTADRESLRPEAEVAVQKEIQALGVSLEAQYKRTEVLRRALSRETPSTAWDPDEPGDNAPEPKSLVGYIQSSRQRWRESSEYRCGMERVREWRRRRGLPLSPLDLDETRESTKEAGRAQVQEIVRNLRGQEFTEEKTAGYDLERDVDAHLIQYTRLNSPDRFNAEPGRTPFDLKMRHLPVHSYEEHLEDVRFKGRFPDQRLSVDWLLRSSHSGPESYQHNLPKRPGHSIMDRNILSKIKCDEKDPTRMRYLHIPANNMEWVESAIAGYYGDEHPALRSSYTGFSHATKTQMLLRPQFWRGQLRDTRSGTVHGRYIRPLCERLSSSSDENEDNPNNIALFVCYHL
jgi:hypothetical protein